MIECCCEGQWLLRKAVAKENGCYKKRLLRRTIAKEDVILHLIAEDICMENGLLMSLIGRMDVKRNGC